MGCEDWPDGRRCYILLRSNKGRLIWLSIFGALVEVVPCEDSSKLKVQYCVQLLSSSEVEQCWSDSFLLIGLLIDGLSWPFEEQSRAHSPMAVSTNQSSLIPIQPFRETRGTSGCHVRRGAQELIHIIHTREGQCSAVRPIAVLLRVRLRLPLDHKPLATF